MELNSWTNANETFKNSKTALIIGVVNLVVGVVSVIGNSFLCLTIYRDSHRRLRNTTSCLEFGIEPFSLRMDNSKIPSSFKKILPYTRCPPAKSRHKERETSTGANAFYIHNQGMVDQETTLSNSKESSKNPAIEIISLRSKNSV